MAKVIVGMTLSLDGFVADKNGSVGRLYPDLGDLRETELMQDAMANTGAVIMGRRTFDMGNGDYTGYEYQVPIFVVTHRAPEQPTKGQNENLKIHFVGDGIESAVRQAKAAAGNRDVVVVGGPDLIRQLMGARLVDEVQIGIMPVMLGGGLPYYQRLGIEPVELEKTNLIESPGGRTDIFFRVKNSR